MQLIAQRVIVVIFLLVFAGTLLGAENWQNADGFRFAPLTVPQGGKPGFTQIPAARSGITFTNTLLPAKYIDNHNYLNGSGVAAGDYDGDGLVDLYFCNAGGKNALFRNLGNWRFEEKTAEAGVACTNQVSTGAAFVDINGDGKLDLVVTSCGGPNACFMNLGGGHFTNVTEQAGLLSKAGSTSIAFADIDGDGDLDIYIANYGENTIRSGLSLSTRMVNGKEVIVGRYASRIRIIQGKMVELGEPDFFGLNDGSGKFTGVSFTAGSFLDYSGSPLKGIPWDMGLSVMFRDMNGDGRPDIYVCDDFQTPDRIWINDGKGHFAPMPKAALPMMSRFSMAIDFADINRDGLMDFFAADMLRRTHRQNMVAALVEPMLMPDEEWDDRPQFRQNILALNRGDGTYAEVAKFGGVAATDWTWSAIFLDVDLDGYEDLLISNGHAFDTEHQDTIDYIGTLKQTRMQTRTNMFAYPKLEPAKAAFRNNGDLTFSEKSDEWAFNSTLVGHGMCLADLDGDGDLDVVINAFNAGPLLYRNESSAPRVAMRLAGKGKNTRGIGAKIEVKSARLNQSQEMIAGGRYLSSDDPMRTFAYLGDSQLEITWPTGRKSRIPAVKANMVYEVAEPESGAVEKKIIDEPKPLFEEVKLSYTNTRGPEIVQSLYAENLGTPGPGLAWTDWNNDGKPDLVVGGVVLLGPDFKGGPASSAIDSQGFVVVDGKIAGSAGPVAMSNGALFQGVRFASNAFPNPTPSKLNDADLNAGMVSGAVFADINGDGAVDLLLACNWGSLRIFLNSGGKFSDATKQFGLDGFTGCWNGIQVGDFDNDGRLDFVASNIGLNCRWQLFHAKPARIYYGDFDGNGSMDVIESIFDTEANHYAPVAHLTQIRHLFPTIAQAFPTAAKYSVASIDEVIAAGQGGKSSFLEAAHLETAVFLNRGDHFEEHALPAEAQFAPGFGIAVADFNLDGNDDIFVAQNFSGVLQELPPMNSGRGVVLMGDGKGNFKTLSTRESGISIAGDQRACAVADFDRDGRPDLAVSVNGGPARLFKNREETSGLRVKVDGPVGARLRLGNGPVRNYAVGGGYWSQDSSTMVFKKPLAATELVAVWPGGKETRQKVEPGATEMVVAP